MKAKLYEAEKIYLRRAIQAQQLAYLSGKPTITKGLLEIAKAWLARAELAKLREHRELGGPDWLV